MAVDAPALLWANWNKFVENGVTEACVFQEMDDTGYVPGGAPIKDVLSSHNVDIVFDEIQKYLTDDSTTKSITKVAILPSLALPVVPKINDLVVDSSLREWEVLAVVADPANAHYELGVKPITP